MKKRILKRIKKLYGLSIPKTTKKKALKKFIAAIEK